ncbi:MAG TPA: response regulator [Planctomycetota bacterium]|nr:response regulator [Planctomycetota bacterium]
MPSERSIRQRLKQPPRFPTKLRILVVDDDERCLESLEGVLSLDGHEIFTATRGFEALDCARRLEREQRRVHLSILDFHMPDLSGLETLVRLVTEVPHVQAILVSGDPSLSLEAEAVRAGARAFVRKPVDLIRIRTLVYDLGRSREVN